MNLIPRNRLFDLDHFFEPSALSSMWPSHSDALHTFSPRVDVKELKDTYEITAELPGVNKEDIAVSIENGVLAIRAETHNEKTEEEDGKVVRQERRYGTYYRNFDLGNSIHEGDINAEFKNGVLKVVAPRTDNQKQEARKITIS